MSELKPIGPSLSGLIASGNLPPALAERERKLGLALQRADLLFRCYPKAEADDPETFAAAASALLSRYPDAVIITVTDPVDGIASRQKWRPHLSEIREACDEQMAPIYREQQRQRRAAETASILKDSDMPREARPTYDDLKAKYGPNWGMSAREEDQEAKQRQREQIDRANKVLFERESAGNPWASSYLTDLVRSQTSEAAE